MSVISRNIELLAPAGSPQALDAAVGEGADAVYLGLKDFNARLRSANFTYAQFESALRTLRRMGKKVYVTVNTVFEQREADRMYQFLKYLASQGPDAIIVQDFGVVAMARSEFPSLRLHASTQMNIASARGANALSRHGISRVVLARELSFEELRGIKKETNMELEVFVHGALCISVSGLCLFSSFLGGKSANRGMCTQACRRLYHKLDSGHGGESGTGGESGADSESGYYFSPNDLQLLEYVPELATVGIKAMKIEGRMKSASYVGAVVSAYRLVVDAVAQGDEDQIRRSIEQGQVILRNDFARPKTRYFFDEKRRDSHRGTEGHGGHGEEEGDRETEIDWLNPQQDGGTGISLGTISKVKGVDEERRIFIRPKKGLVISVRDSVRIHKGGDSGRISHKLSFAQAAESGYWISSPEGGIGDHVYLIQTKEKNKRYAQVITRVSGGKGPGREKAPLPNILIARNDEMSGKKPKKNGTFPEGLYVAVLRPEDLYIVQSIRPQKVELTLTKNNAKYLLDKNKPPLPFKPSEIILRLDPWFAREDEHEDGSTAGEIAKLVDSGYCQYELNNLGHFSLFRAYKNVKLIAGPWLYMFNSWSLSFLASLGAEGFISPLENNRQNLERTLSQNRGGENAGGKRRQEKNSLHSNLFLTVFNWPPLFNIKADLGQVLGFDSFADNRDEKFSLVTRKESSNSYSTRVYPDTYFSIIDKIPFLKEAGFGRFIIDLSGRIVKKHDYKVLMKAVNENSHLPNSGRFNWKDGFYSG